MKAVAWLITLALVILAALYLCAAWMKGFGSVQIVGMVGWQNDGRGRWLHAGYAALLVLGAVGGAGLLRRPGPANRSLSLLAGVLIALVTGVAVSVSVARGNSASFYENYVGELLTLAVAVALGLAALKPGARPA